MWHVAQSVQLSEAVDDWYVEEWIGEGWNTLKYEGEEAVDAGHYFFWKNERAVEVKKTTIIN
jgi:hypothetical protein